MSTRAALALDRLANHYGVTKREILEKLIVAEDEKLLRTIKNDDATWTKYFGEK